MKPTRSLSTVALAALALVSPLTGRAQAAPPVAVTLPPLAPIAYAMSYTPNADGTLTVSAKFTNPNTPSLLAQVLSVPVTSTTGLSQLLSLSLPAYPTVETCPTLSMSPPAATTTTWGLSAPASPPVGVSVLAGVVTAVPIDPNTGKAKLLDGGGYYTFNLGNFLPVPPTGISAAAGTSTSASH